MVDALIHPSEVSSLQCNLRKPITEATLSYGLVPNDVLRGRISDGIILDSSRFERGAVSVASVLRLFQKRRNADCEKLGRSRTDPEAISGGVQNYSCWPIAYEYASSACVGCFRTDPLHGWKKILGEGRRRCKVHPRCLPRSRRRIRSAIV